MTHVTSLTSHSHSNTIKMDCEDQSEEKEHGCFRWLLCKGKKVDERKAKSKNRLREKLYRKQPSAPLLGADDILNVTGTPDMHLVKVSVTMETSKFGAPAVICKKQLQDKDHSTASVDGNNLPRPVREIKSDDRLEAIRQTNKEDAGDQRRVARDMNDLAKLYVADIIQNAEDSLNAATACEEIVQSETGCGGGDIVQSVKESTSLDSIANLMEDRSCTNATGSRTVCDSDSWSSINLDLTCDSIVTYSLMKLADPTYDPDCGENCRETQNAACVKSEPSLVEAIESESSHFEVNF